MESSEARQFPLTDGIVIAGISAFAYLLSYLYERAFLTYYGIPHSFTQVSLTTVLVFAFPLLVVLLGTFFLLELVLSSVPSKLADNWKFRNLLYLVAFFVATIGLLGVATWQIWSVLLVLAALIFVLLLALRRTSARVGRWATKVDPSENYERGGLLKAARTRLGKRFLPLFRSVSMLLLIALIAGMGEATRKTHYLVANTRPETVVLRVNEDYVILAPFNRAEQEVMQTFVIVSTVENPGLVLSREKVGPLKSVPDPTGNMLTLVIPTAAPTP